MSDVIERIKKGEIIIQAFGSEDGISKLCEDELLRLAKIEKAVIQGVKEIMPNTACKGAYQSSTCNDINRGNHGCVLKYYCQQCDECQFTGGGAIK
ncbi:hypothetical protein [Pelosinus sp. IPA-1]|uniref:hypothetical protein n=1 Tax=Pelosinus sp. IPA-1 TaxID=3029569 RepID=UPI002436187B|nr:hypothetical protein [Pelosinus sp. IPA-1]GMB01057.1 hypothetical protein PIPA1_38560 [Pelosinus sp. IPA-1]